MVIIHPFAKMVREIIGAWIWCCILKINDNELSMSVIG
jgi:hypothetical protein